MTLTIYEGYDNSYVIIASKDERFTKVWGSSIKVPTNHIYEQLADLTRWANNTLGEECLFEVD